MVPAVQHIQHFALHQPLLYTRVDHRCSSFYHNHPGELFADIYPLTYIVDLTYAIRGACNFIVTVTYG